MRRALIFLMMMVLVSGCEDNFTDTEADLILIGGHILTQADTLQSTPPTAVALADGKILYVGADEEILLSKGPDTKVVFLKGATVIPGLVDSHCHLYGLGKSLAQIDLMGTESLEQILEIVAQDATKFALDAWIEGRGWDQNDWEVQEYPHRQMLDEIIPDRPVFLRRIDGHAAWANSEALKLANITRESTDPEGGEIIRDEQGEPTGILIDNAVDLVVEVIPEVGPEETRRRIKMAIDHCVAHGLTGVHEAGVSWERAQVYRDLAEKAELDIRVYAMYGDLPATLNKALAAGPLFTDDEMLTIRAIKLYSDGALGSRGALLLDDYTDQPGHRGLPVTPANHMRDVMQKGGRAGFQICTHAIGDQANRLVLDLYEEVLGELKLEDAATWTGPTKGWAKNAWPVVMPGGRCSIPAPTCVTERISRWKRWILWPDSTRPSPGPTPTAPPSAAGSPRKPWIRPPPWSFIPPAAPGRVSRKRNGDVSSQGTRPI